MTMTRRSFVQAGTTAGGLALASRVLPGTLAFGQAAAASSGRKLGYAVIGLGEIAGHFIAGVAQSQNSKITGLVSGDRAKAEAMAAKLGLSADAIYSYADMDRMRDNKSIDAVYIALPNSMHAEFTIRSAKAGKHVLCEKPMAVSVDECEQMIAACRAAKVKLMIAYRMHYEPLTLEAIQRLRAGEIGDILAIESAFGFPIRPGVWRVSKKLGGGGPLVDVGIYCLNATRYLTGEEPVEFRAFASTRTRDERFREIEESLSWTTRFPSGIVASCNTTYGGAMPGFIKVSGTKGTLEMGPAFDYEGIRLMVRGPGAPVDKTNPERDPLQFTREADHLAECVFSDREPTTAGEEGLRDMRYIAAIYKAAGAPV